jgi:NADPH:quinone reductase-like Zn-dependent oxidoreductase
MKAAILDRPGGPDAFRLADVPVPECGPGDVLVEVMACGVSSRDVAERNGTYRRHVTFPLIIGLEISGFVRKVGAQVSSLKVGDYIASKAFSSCGMCRYCRTSRETSCLQRQPVRGGYAEFTALAEDAAVKIPNAIPFEAACSLGPATGVALNAVRDTARVAMGEIVLVTGATGGLGVPSMQLAKIAGARVLALTRNASKAAMLREAGADDIVVMDGDGKFASKIAELTDGYGVDVVIDNVGSPVFWECFQSLALHGRYAAVGQLVGERVEINLARIFFKRAQILGVGSVSRVQLSDVATLMAHGHLSAQIDRILPLEDVALAHELVESGKAAGRVVLMADATRAAQRSHRNHEE